MYRINVTSTYRIDPTHCDTSFFLLQIQGHYEMDHEHTDWYRRRLYRLQTQFIEFHYYNIKRQYHHDHAASSALWDSPPPNMILFSNIEGMILNFIFTTRFTQCNLPRQYSTHGTWVVSKVDRILDVERIRCIGSCTSLAQRWSYTTTSPSMALIFDIRETGQWELQENRIVKIFITVTILPFVPYTPKSLPVARLLRRRITSYVATATRQISASTARFPNHPFVSMIVTDRSIHPNFHGWSKCRVDPTTETVEMIT